MNFYGKTNFMGNLTFDGKSYFVDADFYFDGHTNKNDSVTDVSIEIEAIAVESQDGKVLEGSGISSSLQKQIDTYLEEYITYCYDTGNLSYDVAYSFIVR